MTSTTGQGTGSGMLAGPAEAAHPTSVLCARFPAEAAPLCQAFPLYGQNQQGVRRCPYDRLRLRMATQPALASTVASNRMLDGSGTTARTTNVSANISFVLPQSAGAFQTVTR